MSRISRFKYPFFILMLCLGIIVVGVTTVVRMPVDLFPQIKIPVVVVATFYSGMPPQQIEADITDTFERFFTLGSNIDHIESRSLTGVSLIKVYFQPGTDPDAAVSEIANLAMADLRRLPQGTLPPVVLKFDASSLPVCLVTLKGQGLNETQLHDLGQFNVRNQIANVPGASVPQPFGGKYRQIQFYVDPVKLEAAQLSPMDVVARVNKANTILPAGDVRIGPLDYNIYSNSQLPNVARDERCAAEGDRQQRAALRRYRPRRRFFGACSTTSCASTGRSRSTCRSCGRAATATPSRSSTACETASRDLLDIPKNAGCHRGLRSVAVREDRDGQRAARGRHGPGADGADDPGFPGLACAAQFRCCCRFRSPAWRRFCC